ncbi:MAG: hypothetical protein RH942_18510 [Kiloniellaceae bacterium]
MTSIGYEGSDLTRADIDTFINRGRLLQSQAMRAGLQRAFRYLVGGCSLRSLRFAGQRQPCC